MRNVYIAGPMRGYAEFNFPAFFDEEEALLRSPECKAVFNPARRDMDAGVDVTGCKGDLSELPEFNLREALAADTGWICEHADEIRMLPGWSKSSGATAERALGIALGLTISGAPA